MTTFYRPADRPEDWQLLLAKPNLHWRTGYSAKTLAHSWTEARGFPAEIVRALQSSGIPAIANLDFLLGIPEHAVPLPGGKRPSQTDVFVLARGREGLVTIAVEGKVSESFDRPVGERFAHPTPGETERLAFLCGLMQLSREEIDHIGYQLLHRSASAIIEARRFGAAHAVMLIHSFSQSLAHFEDYKSFSALYGVQAAPDQIHQVAELDGISLYLGWAVGNYKYLES